MTKHNAIEQKVPFPVADWFDPLETGVRQHIRSFIEAMLEEEVAAAESPLPFALWAEGGGMKGVEL